jgi:hypothetical protein
MPNPTPNANFAPAFKYLSPRRLSSFLSYTQDNHSCKTKAKIAGIFPRREKKQGEIDDEQRPFVADGVKRCSPMP